MNRMIQRLAIRRLAQALPLALAVAVLSATLPVAAQQLRASAPAASSAPRQADYIVAVVNSEPITNTEVRARLAVVEQQAAREGARLPPREQLAQQVLERLISERAQLQVARESGLKVEDAQVDQAEQNVARQNQIDVPQLRRRLELDGIGAAAFREDLRRQLLLQRVRERESDARVRVSEADIDQFLREQQAEAGKQPVELNLAQVLVAVPETATPEQVEALRGRAQRVRQRAAAGEDFAALARQASDAPDAVANGGAFGMRSADRYPTLFLEATQDLPVGGVSEVIRSGAGFHVLKVLDKQTGGMTIVQSHPRHILLRPGPQLSEAAARERLADFKRRIEAGQANFATLAREHSQDASAAEGGDLGWVNPGMFVPEFEEVMDSLAPGRLSEPTVSRFGVHLIQLLERRQVALGPREQREAARNILREKKQEEAYARWVRDVRGRAWVEMREPPQ